MQNKEIQEILKKAFVNGEVIVEGDGYHYQVKIISPAFSGLSKVSRQQKVYQLLKDQIASGRLHAISIEALTPEEIN